MTEDGRPADGDGTAEESSVEPATGAGGPLRQFAFLGCLLGFLGSAVVYAVTLATGGDVALPVAANAATALGLVALTAHATYADPESAVTSLPGALGTALLMLGVYGVVASVAVAATSLWHDRFALAIWLGAAAALAAVMGFFTFPAEVVGGDGAGDGSDRSGDDDRSGTGGESPGDAAGSGDEEGTERPR